MITTTYSLALFNWSKSLICSTVENLESVQWNYSAEGAEKMLTYNRSGKNKADD